MKQIAAVFGALALLAGCGVRTATTQVVSETGESPEVVTTRAVDEALAHAPVPAGSRPATAAEAHGKTAMYAPMDSHLIDHHRTYVVPLSTEDAVAWFNAHPPPGLENSGSGTELGPDGMSSSGIIFDGHLTPTYGALEEQVDVYPLDDAHSVVRVDVQAVWNVPRAPAERVPGNADSVQVVRVTRSSRRPQRFTLTGADLRRLALVVNKQDVVEGGGGPINCPNDTGGHDVLHFTGTATDLMFRVQASGCGFIAVTANGVAQPILGGGFAVDRALQAILGQRS